MSDGIRTRDVQSHSLALYQAELRSPHQRATPPNVRYTFVASGTEECQPAPDRGIGKVHPGALTAGARRACDRGERWRSRSVRP